MNRPEIFPEAASHRTTDYRADIDGLRAIAVLAVIAFHAFPSFAPGGFVGVDIFFVISGYLITRIIAREIDAGTYSTLHFYERRIRRIAPAFIVVVATTTVGATLLYVPAHFDLFGKSLLAAVLIHANIFFFKESGYFSAPDEVLPLLHVWSLSVEEQFYVVFPIFLMLVSRWRIRAGAIVLALAVSFAASCVMVTIIPDAAFYLAQYRAWELLIGAVLALNIVPAASGSIANGCSWVGAILIATGIWGISASSAFPGWNASIPCIGAALLIHAGQGTAVNRLLAWPPMVFVGLISYSFYLWHWPLLSFGAYTAMRPLTSVEAGAAVILAFLAAWASYRFVETPFRHRQKKLPLTPLFAAGAALLALATVASVTNGAEWRLPSSVATITGYEATRVGMPPDHCGVEKLAAEDGRLSSLLNLKHAAICRFGSPSVAPSIVLWGDSHGDAVAPALGAVLSRKDKAGYSISRGGCPPIAGIDRIDGPTWQCKHFAEAALDAISRIRPDFVIVAARWPYYFEGTRYGAEKGNGPVFAAIGNFEIATEALDATIARLQQVAPILLMEGIPEIGSDVPSMLGRAAILGRKIDLAVTRSAYDLRQKRSVAILERLARKYALPLLKPQDILCDTKECHVTRAGMALYADSNHLSRSGSVVLEPMFANALQPMVR